MHNYSPEDLILYLYKETSQEATAAIEKALQEDWTLREKYLMKRENEDLFIIQPLEKK